jgi:serine/threonine-protein kinase HipA
MELTYEPKWLASPESRPLSLSLPTNLDGVAIKGDVVEWFFDNLLPDSDAIRRRVRARYGVPGDRAFDLLAAIGRDCVGAVQLLPADESPEGFDTITATPLRESQIEALLVGVTAPAGAHDDEDVRISIAGAQEKTALVWHRGRWCIPRGATPSTHIFKLPLGLVGGRRLDLSSSLENEWLCSRLLASFGVPVAKCEVTHFGSVKALVVERFDRTLHSSKRYWLRLPQEDLCQATGTPSSKKYEVDGGPGLIEIAAVLRGSEAREDDLATLMRAQLLFWMLVATDGHAKNFSIRLLAGGRFRLAPLYDVISMWPIAGTRGDQIHPSKLRLAMALHGKSKHYGVDAVRFAHFEETARRCGVRGRFGQVVEGVIAGTGRAIDAVAGELPKGFPGRVFETITKQLAKRAELLPRRWPG